MFKHREERFTLANDIFSSTPNITIEKEENLEPLMKKLEGLLIKENNVWWEIVTLEKYLAHQLIPKGLIIEKIPAYNLQNNEFMTKWDNILHTCSFSLMEFIMKEKRVILKEMEETINKLSIILDKFENSTVFKHLEEQVIFRVRRSEKELVIRKQKKFKRDK